MKLKKNERLFDYEGRSFKATVKPNGIYGMACVFVEEFRPKARIFKWKWHGSFDFWLCDYESIEDGARAMVAKVLSEEADDLKLQKKWKEFENKY
jgi:hypothetical protein